MSTADFYTWEKNSLDWIGSLYTEGEPWYIPVEILIQVNKIIYEEMLVSFLKIMHAKAVVNENFQKWPWLWPTSDMTEYVYIFNKKIEKVVLFYDGNVIDPIRIIQGYDVMNSLMPFAPKITFPDMTKRNTQFLTGNNDNGS